MKIFKKNKVLFLLILFLLLALCVYLYKDEILKIFGHINADAIIFNEVSMLVFPSCLESINVWRVLYCLGKTFELF